MPVRHNQGPAQHRAYYETHNLTVTLRGVRTTIVSKPGLPEWDRVSRANILLAENITLAPDAKVVVFGSGHGALGVALARQLPAGHVQLVDQTAIAAAMAQQTLEANRIGNASVSRSYTLLPEQRSTANTVVVEIPKGRKLARRWLVEAYELLEPGGQLYVAGPNDEGIQSIVADVAALFGEATTVTYKARNRVALANKPAHEPEVPTWSREPGIAPGTWHELALTVDGAPINIRTLPGVFSYDGLDAGTALLIEHLHIQPGDTLLDVGCGYGIIGLVAARRGAAQVEMVDVNLLAVAAAQENIRHNGIQGAEAKASDVLSAVAARQYDLVVSNPPFHTGKGVDYEAAAALIGGSREILKAGGRLLLVANRFIRYDELMRTSFAEVAVVASNPRYHVLLAR